MSRVSTVMLRYLWLAIRTCQNFSAKLISWAVCASIAFLLNSLDVIDPALTFHHSIHGFTQLDGRLGANSVEFGFRNDNITMEPTCKVALKFQQKSVPMIGLDMGEKLERLEQKGGTQVGCYRSFPRCTPLPSGGNSTDTSVRSFLAFVLIYL